MFTYFLLCVIGYLLHKLDFYNIAHETYKIKKRKLTRLKTLVSTQYTGIARILWVCLCMLFKALYLMLIQWLYQSVRPIGSNLYEVSYVIRGITYKFHVKLKKGPGNNTIIQATDENDSDITNEFLTYLGPMDNFHGYVYTPKHFGVNAITLNMASGEDKTFTEHEPINFKTD